MVPSEPIALLLASYFNSGLSKEQLVALFSQDALRQRLFQTRLIFVFNVERLDEEEDFAHKTRLIDTEWYQHNFALFSKELESKSRELEAGRTSLVAADINKALCGLGEVHETYGDYNKAIEYFNEALSYDSAAVKAGPGGAAPSYELLAWKECRIMRLNYLLGNWQQMHMTATGRDSRLFEDRNSSFYTKWLLYSSMSTFHSCLTSTCLGGIKGNGSREREWKKCLELAWKCINSPEFLNELDAEPISALEFTLCPIIACIICQRLTQSDCSLFQSGIVVDYSLEAFRMNSVFERVLNRIPTAVFDAIQAFLDGNLFGGAELVIGLLKSMNGLHRELFGKEANEKGKTVYSVLQLATFSMYSNAFHSFPINACTSFEHFRSISNQFLYDLQREQWLGDDDFIVIEGGMFVRRTKEQKIEVSFDELDKGLKELHKQTVASSNAQVA